jgi:hypothetical protein
MYVVTLKAWEFDDDRTKVHAHVSPHQWKKRRTPLMAAACAGHTGVAQLLIDAGAAVDKGKEENGAVLSVSWILSA